MPITLIDLYDEEVLWNGDVSWYDDDTYFLDSEEFEWDDDCN